MDLLRAITPGCGSYVNEADFFEHDWLLIPLNPDTKSGVFGHRASEAAERPTLCERYPLKVTSSVTIGSLASTNGRVMNAWL